MIVEAIGTNASDVKALVVEVVGTNIGSGSGWYEHCEHGATSIFYHGVINSHS